MDEQNFQNNQDSAEQRNFSEYYQDNTAESNPYQPTPQAMTNEPAKSETPAVSIVGLIMGIIGIVMGCCYGIGIVPGIAGLVCSIIGQKKKSTGVGIAGLICSIIGILLAVVFLVILAIGFAELANNPGLYEEILNGYGY